jgi:hypothetical protein
VTIVLYGLNSASGLISVAPPLILRPPANNATPTAQADPREPFAVSKSMAIQSHSCGSGRPAGDEETRCTNRSRRTRCITPRPALSSLPQVQWTLPSEPRRALSDCRRRGPTTRVRPSPAHSLAPKRLPS